MEAKDYHKTREEKLSFEQWRADLAPQMPQDQVDAYNRLHNYDYNTEWETMLRNEYAEYLSNLNGNWLL